VRGRLTVAFALGRNYLFLPFAVLSMAATILHHQTVPRLGVIPFLLLVVAGFASNRLADAYERVESEADAALWARRFTRMSGATGAAWGLGAILWFIPGSFPDEAYLVLAMLGMSATEFVARAAYRPAYLAHATVSLVPLALMLVIQGGALQLLSALIVLCFGAALYGYADKVGALLDQCSLTVRDNATKISTLNAEKEVAEERREAALARDRAKSAFVATISHELRTPLSAILGMAQLLERSDLEKAQRDHVRVLLESCRGLKTLLDDIIALVQDERERPTIEDGADAAQAAQTVTRLLQPNAWEKRLRLSLAVAPGMPRVAADAHLLRRILLKLVGNAIKFTERGHVEISVDSITDVRGGKLARIAITDTGPGIPQHVIPSLFDPFANPEADAERGPGTGVGLAVAKRLIESLGGTIGVESEPGMGARFWFTIPALTLTVAPEREGPDDIAPPQGLTLMCYLPDPQTLAIVESWLAPFGNRLVAARTLAEACAIAARGGFDAAIAAASAADALAVVPGQATPILALAQSDDRAAEGATEVLHWPAAPSMLYSALFAITRDAPATGREDGDNDATAIDGKAFAELEKSLGFKTLIDILQSYLKTAEELAKALAAASEQEDWDEAGRLAQDIAGAAGGLGLSALTSAARTLAQGAREGVADPLLAAAAGDVLSAHRRSYQALRRLYPDLSA
jgi:signal transduction histidine kinase/HPt (histidine-containing phosphotransfer) domain-containing protein